MVNSAPCIFSTPLMMSVFEPIFRISAPMAFSMWQSSWTCGSEAALRIMVWPLALAAAISVFSVAVTLASSSKISAPQRPGVLNLKRLFSKTNWVPNLRKARICVSTRRRPITSPPGGGSTSLPSRASIGPASRMEARIILQTSGSRSEALMFLAVKR